jgi:hypothetical protein
MLFYKIMTKTEQWNNLQLKGELTTKYAQTKAEHHCVAEVETRLEKA